MFFVSVLFGRSGREEASEQEVGEVGLLLKTEKLREGGRSYLRRSGVFLRGRGAKCLFFGD